jgi:hypothetical protein
MFKFDANFDESSFGVREKREQTTLESGAKYEGQWLKDRPDVRQGRGT